MRLQLLVLISLLPLIAQGQMYRWVDDSGKVHYSDRAPAAKVKELQVRPLQVSPASAAALPYSLQQASKNFPVTLYTAKDCGDPCAQARKLLEKRGIPYTESSIKDDVGLKQLKSVTGETSVPAMTIGREVYKGYESGAYNSALDAAGYPATSVLPPGTVARKAEAEPQEAPAGAAAPNPVAAEAPKQEQGADTPQK